MHVCVCEEAVGEEKRERDRQGERGDLCFYSDVLKWKILQTLTGMEIITLDK